MRCRTKAVDDQRLQHQSKLETYPNASAPIARRFATDRAANHHGTRELEGSDVAVHAHWATHSALAAWVMHRLTGLPYSITAPATAVTAGTGAIGISTSGRTAATKYLGSVA